MLAEAQMLAEAPLCSDRPRTHFADRCQRQSGQVKSVLAVMNVAEGQPLDLIFDRMALSHFASCTSVPYYHSSLADARQQQQ